MEYSYSLMPVNNLNFTVNGMALATSKTETGVSLDQTTLKSSPGQQMSPMEKTLTNCVLGSYVASAGASTVYDTLGTIDPKTMMGDMDPAAEMDKVIDQLKTTYKGAIDGRKSFST